MEWQGEITVGLQMRIDSRTTCRSDAPRDPASSQADTGQDVEVERIITAEGDCPTIKVKPSSPAMPLSRQGPEERSGLIVVAAFCLRLSDGVPQSHEQENTVTA